MAGSDTKQQEKGTETKNLQFIVGFGLVAKLCSAMGFNPNVTKRIIIDCGLEETVNVSVTVETYGTEVLEGFDWDGFFVKGQKCKPEKVLEDHGPK